MKDELHMLECMSCSKDLGIERQTGSWQYHLHIGYDANDEAKVSKTMPTGQDRLLNTEQHNLGLQSFSVHEIAADGARACAFRSLKCLDRKR